REECRFCNDTQALLEDLARINPLLRLAVHERGADNDLDARMGVERVPATVMRGVLNRPVTLYGIPINYLFAPLLETLILLSQNRAQLPPRVAKLLKRLREPVRLRVFVSPESEFCVGMMTAAFAFAVESKQVHAEVVEVAEFPRLGERYGVQQVPFTLINDRAAFPGLVEPEVFAEQIVKAATSRTLAAPPRGQSTPLTRPEQPQQRENVRPSGLIIPGR
ncbi:MAG TPA: thioredoxin family protein, partial [Dehalococcoidia bacterium]|nr:thioredoxin family protein [Dehalococcoidia bacterium]